MGSDGGHAWKWLKTSGCVYFGGGTNKGNQEAGSISSKGKPLIKGIDSVFLSCKGKTRILWRVLWNHLAVEVGGA